MDKMPGRLPEAVQNLVDEALQEQARLEAELAPLLAESAVVQAECESLGDRYAAGEVLFS